MLLLWILTTLAVGSPPEGDGAVPTSHAVEVVLPEGVTTGPTARELARSPHPRGVSFTASAKPSIADGRLVLEGTLTNSSTRSVTVFVETHPERPSPLELVPKGATYLRQVPTGRLSPVEWVLPPQSEVPFRTALVLSDWTWPEGGAEVEWVFHFWKEEVRGTLTGKLSPP